MNNNAPVKELAALARTTERLLDDGEPLDGVVDAAIRDVENLMHALAGYIVLWDGQPCAVGAIDGTLGIDPEEPTVFADREAAQKAIDEKAESYKAYARAYPNTHWPSPSASDFRVIPARPSDHTRGRG